MANDRYSGYLSASNSHTQTCHRLAASQRDKLLIEEIDLIEANKLLETIEPGHDKGLRIRRVVDESKHIANILAHVRAYTWIEGAVLFNLLRNTTTERDSRMPFALPSNNASSKVTSRGGKRASPFLWRRRRPTEGRKRMTLSNILMTIFALTMTANAIALFRYWQMLRVFRIVLNNLTNLQEQSSTS